MMRTSAQFVGILAAAVACLTVCTLPWILGGVVPLARTILIGGAVTAGLLSLLSSSLSGRLPASLPVVVFPIIGLIMLGTWQLRPVEADPVSAMTHGVSEPNVADLPMPVSSASISPADTRTTIGTLLAVATLGIVCFDRIRTRKSAFWFCGALLLNGLTLTGIGLTGLFQDTELEINTLWSLGTQKAFAGFVNPNNAAGWICLGFAIAAGWLAMYVRAASASHRHSMGAVRMSLGERLWTGAMQFLAELTVWKILAFVAFTGLAAGVAVTRSRGGLLALATGTVVAAMLASSMKRIPIVIGTIFLCAAGVYATLNLLDLNSGVATEIRTLRDLDSAAGSRPRHWLDSLHLMFDFPLTGTGLGSYRFATLPYQTLHTGLWYRFADNNFVDIAVEGGLVGLILFLSVGLCGLLTGLAGWRQCRKPKQRSKHQGQESPEHNAPFLWGVGTMAVVAALTQAVSGFFDYGVSMPAAAALLVVIVCVTAGCLNEAEPTSNARRTGAVQGGRMLVFSVHLCLISSAAAYFFDQKAAAEIDQSVVSATNLLAYPVDADELDQVNNERQLLEQRLRRRPDDPEGLTMLAKLADADFRWRVMRSEYGKAVRKRTGFELLWQRYTPLTIAADLAALSERNPIAAVQRRVTVQQKLKDSGLADVFSRIQRRFPLMPNIAERRAELAILNADPEEFARQSRHALFVEPANAETYYRLGLLAMYDGQHESAEQYWKQSTELAAAYRGSILLHAKQHWPGEEAMQLFGPTSYIECIVAAQECRDVPLKTTLLNRSERLWSEQLAPQDDDSVAALRAWQLTSEKRDNDAVAWLRERVRLPGEHVTLRRQLARVLYRQKKFDEAAAEWHTINYLLPDDPEAVAALQELRNKRQALKSTD